MYQKLRRVNDRRHRELVYVVINRANLREARRLYRKDTFSSAPTKYRAFGIEPVYLPRRVAETQIGICEPVAFCVIAKSYDRYI